MLLADELIIDSFAGGGGASLGIEIATGRSPDVAINHDAEAIAMHRINHPTTHHLTESVWDVNIVDVTQGRPIGLLWASPDCTHHSKAKGGRPVSNKRRGLAGTMVRWARQHTVRPRVICLENVSEFADWGPLHRRTSRPNRKRRGESFRKWVRGLERLGYRVGWRLLRASDYGTPTIRHRLFLVARCDGQAIRWPAPIVGPRRSAGSCIDWSVPTRSIFGRARPLVPATLQRLAAGIRREVFGARPYLVPPSSVMHTPGAHADEARAFIAKHYSVRSSTEVMAASLFDPMPTITTVDHNALVTVHFGEPEDQSEEVRAFCVAYFGNERDGISLHDPARTVTTRDRFALVTVHGRGRVITDIRQRMLTPREAFRVQGFGDDYVIDHGIDADGQRVPLTKTAQMRMAGNSVCPPIAAAIVSANLDAPTRQLERVA